MEIPLPPPPVHSTVRVLSTHWGIYRHGGKELKVFADRGAEKRFQKQNRGRDLFCTLPYYEGNLLYVTFSTTW